MKTFRYLLVVPFLFFAMPAMALEVGDKAPCVVLEGLDADGNDVEECIRDVADEQDFTLIEFGSVKCTTCQKNLPILGKLARQIEDVATTRVVFIDRSQKAIDEYLAKSDVARHISFPVAFDTDRDAKRAYDVFKTPTLFLLENMGEGEYIVRFKHSGEVLGADEIKEIKELVGADKINVGDTAPCVVLDGLSAAKKKVNGCIRNSVDGQDFTLLEFSSIHCSTCQKNLPILGKLATEIEEFATVRNIFVDRDQKEIEKYINQKSVSQHLTFPVAFDTDRDAKRAYDVYKTPTLFLLENMGEGKYIVRFKHKGSVLGATDIAEIKELIGMTEQPVQSR